MTESTRPHRTPEWDQLLATVRAELLDCLQSNLALVADHFHGPGAHLALGAEWRFESDPDRGAEKSPDHRAAEARRTAGVGLAPVGTGSAVLHRLSVDTGPLYVLGDARSMSWTPYYGREHMTHSFLLCPGPGADQVTVVDAYHNDTPYGAARPGRWVLSAAEIEAVLDDTATAHAPERLDLPATDTGAVLTDNARRLRAAAPAVDDYLARVRSGATAPLGASRLVLDIWLLGRERALHENWLRHRGLPAESVEPVTALVDQYRVLATQSYVAWRRGSVEPKLLDRLEEALRGEADLAERLAAAHGRPDEALAACRSAVQEVLGIDAATLDRAPSLRDLPGFDSFRLVEVLDLVERRLGRRWNSAELSAESLHDVVSLALLFSESSGGLPAGVRS